MTAVPTADHIRAVLVAIAAAVAATLVMAGPAVAAKKPSCAEQVVADWYDNGRVDYLYPLHCYRDAIKSLPPDVKDYSSAKEEIERALQDAANRPPVKEPTLLETTGSNPGDPSETETDPGGETIAGGGDGDGPSTAGPSSVPIPLIVLGGLSILLLAAGSAGYLARRFGKGDGADSGDPPVAV